MIEINGKYYDTEEEAHKAVETECAAYRQMQISLTEDEKRARAAGEEFFILLRKRQPDMFNRRLISLPVLTAHKSAIKQVVESMRHSLKHLVMNSMNREWPVRISEAASREFEYWLREMAREKGLL